jgi:Asp/Glu/hydantoin racemase
MRILVVNPNTDKSATDFIRKEAEKVASPDVEVVAITAPSGPIVIVTPEDTQRAGEVVLGVISEYQNEIDGAITAAYSDPGLTRAREAFSFPIVGIGESSMKEAARISNRFVIISGNPHNESIYRGFAEKYGVTDKLTNIRFLAKSGSEVDRNGLHDSISDRETLLAAVVEECKRAVDENEAEAIVVAGGPLAGLASEVSREVFVPVLDCVGCAVQRIERWLRTGSAD